MVDVVELRRSRGPETLVVALFAQAPRGVIVTGQRLAFGAGLRVPLVQDRVDVEIVRVLECSGFFEAPMSPLFHGPTPSGAEYRPVSVAAGRPDPARRPVRGSIVYAAACGPIAEMQAVLTTAGTVVARAC